MSKVRVKVRVFTRSMSSLKDTQEIKPLLTMWYNDTSMPTHDFCSTKLQANYFRLAPTK